MKKKVILGIGYLMLWLFSYHSMLYSKMKTGVVEFEERNSIGLENGGKIIAELLAEELVNIGKYEVMERILLKKILEEQELSLTGIIGTETAPKIGKIYGLEGIITGSYMKLGNLIVINARLINTQSGKVINASTVKMEKLEDLKPYIEILANELSDIKRDELKKIKEAKFKKMTKSGILIGSGYGFDYINNSAISFPLGFFYNSKLLNFEIIGFPFGMPTGIGGFIGINLTEFLGINMGYCNTYGKFEDYEADISAGKERFIGEFNILFFGIGLRPSHKLIINFSLGGMLKGKISYHTADLTGTQYWYNIEINDFMNEFPGSNFRFTVDYYLNESWGIRLFYLQTGGKDLIIEDRSTDDSKYYSIGSSGLMISYSFSFL